MVNYLMTASGYLEYIMTIGRWLTRLIPPKQYGHQYGRSLLLTWNRIPAHRFTSGSESMTLTSCKAIDVIRNLAVGDTNSRICRMSYQIKDFKESMAQHGLQGRKLDERH